MAGSPQVVAIPGGSFSETDHCYRDDKNVAIPSTTQILDGVGLSDFSSVPHDVLERKRALGDALHYAARFDDLGDLDPYSVHQDVAPYLIGYQRFRDEVGFIPEEEYIEKSFIATTHGMKFAGTIDRLGRFLNSRIKAKVLLEIKTGYDESASWKLQLAAYELALPKQPETIARVALKLSEDSSFKLYLYENARDRDVFLAALSLTNWKINEGLKWRRS